MELISPLFVNLIAVAAGITGLLLAAWWIVSLYWLHSRDAESRLSKIDLPDELGEVLSGIPASLVAFYLFIAMAMVAYVLYMWLGGISY